jgi:photosynthetic reaction center H subunit
VQAPKPEPVESVAAEPVAGFMGAPLEPTGNPMKDGVGPASWCNRADHPDMTMHGLPQIAPLRIADDFHVAEQDTDPRGMNVVAADGRIVGTIHDLWVDRIEPQIRYMEIALDERLGGAKVLLPLYFCRINTGRGEVRVNALMSGQFADVPKTKHPDQVTLLEEDKICAYYSGGTLYAEPNRTEPML